jgi:hypothetical protein
MLEHSWGEQVQATSVRPISRRLRTDDLAAAGARFAGEVLCGRVVALVGPDRPPRGKRLHCEIEHRLRLGVKLEERHGNGLADIGQAFAVHPETPAPIAGFRAGSRHVFPAKEHGRIELRAKARAGGGGRLVAKRGGKQEMQSPRGVGLRRLGCLVEHLFQDGLVIDAMVHERHRGGDVLRLDGAPARACPPRGIR